MNDLQKVQLDLLKLFTDICDRLGLTYYLVCGSALGAVKYGGFIPWDDDADVALRREEYEIFLKEAPALLPEHVFLQNYRTDPEYHLLGSKLRHSGTTYIEREVMDFNMNQGVFIDVFPLDGYPDDPGEIARFEKKKVYYERRRVVRTKYNRWATPKAVRTNLVYILYKLFGYCKDTAKTLAAYEKMVSSYPTEGSRRWCNHSNWQGVLEYAPAEQYGDGVLMTFEGLTVRVPADYDAYLRQKYGDYTKDPPIEEQVPSHAYLVDLETPYQVSLETLRQRKK